MSAPSSVGNASILVVDDERDIVRAVTRHLERAALRVTGLTNPLEAREMFSPGRFAVIVSDHMMPGLQGLELLREAVSLAPQTRRVLLTGFANQDEAIEAFNQGVLHRFLRKPWTEAELVNVVQEEAAAFHQQTRAHTEHQDLERLLSKRTQLMHTAMALMQDSDRDALEAAQPGVGAETSRDAAVLIADVVGYSRLMHEDAAATVETLTAFQMVAIEAIVRHGGRLVNAPGDSLLAEFPAPTQALLAAQATQRELARRNAALPDARQMRLRMGIAYGTLLVRLGEIFGDPVNIAARLQQRAEPGGVCIAEAAWRMLPAAQQRGLNALGPQQFKNIAEPVHTYIWHPHTAGRKA